MKLNPLRLTMILCTTLVIFLSLYDLGVILATDSIQPSVSAWTASFGCYFVPVFGMSFLMGHFFGKSPQHKAKMVNMTKFHFFCTLGTIVATIYDIIMIQFLTKGLAISSLPVLLKVGQYPMGVTFLGLIAGKYLGAMSPTVPAGDNNAK